MTMQAFSLSEEYGVPVIVRLTTRVAHSQSLVETAARQDVPLRPYEKNIAKNVMMPANAIRRHVVVEERAGRRMGAEKIRRMTELVQEYDRELAAAMEEQKKHEHGTD